MSITRTWMMIWVLAAGAPGGQAAAAPDIGALIAQLGSGDWAVRQGADTELRNLEPAGIGPIEPYLARADLSPEQSFRLRAIAIDRFRRGPHGALGISLPISPVDDGFDPVRAQPFVVSGLVPGFDAQAKLKDRDVVAAMDGVPIRNPDVMRAAILSHSPGEVATISVLRGAVRLDLQVTLGDFAALRENARPPDEGTLDYAFGLCLARRGGSPLLALPPALGGPSARDRPAGAPNPATAPLPGDDDELLGLMVGGEGRGRLVTPFGGFGQPRRMMRIVAPAGARPQESRRTLLERRRDELQTQMDLLLTIINRPLDARLPAAQKAQAAGATQAARQELNRLADQARRVEAEIDRLPPR